VAAATRRACRRLTATGIPPTYRLGARHQRCHCESSKYESLSLPTSLAAIREAWLIVPLRTADQTVGFVVLTEPRVKIDLDWEVLDLLKTAGRQAGSYLAYAQATEALLERASLTRFIECRRLSCMI